MARIDRLLIPVNSSHYAGSATNYVVQTPSGVLYIFYVDGGTDVYYIKSTDGGITWGVAVVVFAGTVTAVSIWYDRWSNISADLIHCAYTESVGSDILYRSLDAASDTLGTQTTVFNGVSAVGSNGALSITRARGGNLLVGGMIDAGAESIFARSVDVGANWTSRTDTLNEASAVDQYILVPGWGADNQDIMAFFWDSSAAEISRKLYDDSLDTWAETSIATSMTALAIAFGFANFAATVDIANTRNLLVAWSATDTLNADLRCWTVTESAITETTANVVLNSVDDQGYAAIAIDTVASVWYVFYCGKSDGSETHNTSLNIYYKTSSNGGVTWSAETLASQQLRFRRWLATTPRFAGAFTTAYLSSEGGLLVIGALLDLPFGQVLGG